MTNNREEQIYKAADKATYQTPPQYSELVHKSRKAMCAYEVGFIDGCVWADSHPHWIPVEDRLPELTIDDWRSEYVFFATDDGKSHFGFYSNKGVWFSSVYGFNGHQVTHWMPLPTPPQGKEATMTDQTLKQAQDIKRTIAQLEGELEKFDNIQPNGINVFLPNVGTLIEDVRQDFLLQLDLQQEKFRKL